MFKSWQVEKAVTALIDEAQALADKLQMAKPHVVDGLAAAAHFWAVSFAADGQNLHAMEQWAPAEVRRFASGAATRIATLRKARAYDSADGLTVWLHSARSLAEPRIAPAVRAIWARLAEAGSNADAWAADLLADASLPADQPRRTPIGFGQR